MKYMTVDIDSAKLTLYIISNSPEMNPDRRRPFVLICPGGGYSFVSDREAEPVALRFCAYGFNTAVLRYSCNPDGTVPIYPKPQQELSDAISYVRENAEQLNTNASMITVMGFSAGAHLAASVGCFWDKFNPNARPDALVLCYPVITDGVYAHKGSFDNLCGSDSSARALMSLENQVTSTMPPTYMWHTKTDNAVPVQNTILFKEALDRCNVPNEMHLFETGFHGLSLATDEVSKVNRRTVNEEVQIWPQLVRSWLLGLFGENWY